MGRKPQPKWTVDDVIEVFNSLPVGERRMTKRDLYRLTSGWRDRAHFNFLFAQLICPLPGKTHLFVAEPDPADSQRTWVRMINRGY